MLKLHSTWKADHEIVEGFPVGLTTRLFDETPAHVGAKVRAAMRPFKPIARVSPDAIHDAELVAEVTRRR